MLGVATSAVGATYTAKNCFDLISQDTIKARALKFGTGTYIEQTLSVWIPSGVTSFIPNTSFVYISETNKAKALYLPQILLHLAMPTS